MLDKLKKSVKTLTIGILVALLVLAFAFWGVGDIFRSTVPTDVAQVGNVSITGAEFNRQFRLEVRRISNETGELVDTLQARAAAVDHQVLSRMINTAALTATSADMGLTISDETLLQIITETEIFQGTFGEFSRVTYEELLIGNQLTPQSYEVGLRNDLANQQIINSVAAGAVAPRKMAELFYNFVNERRAIDYVLIPPSKAGDIPEPSQTEIESYYKENAFQFTAPEYRRVTILLVRVEDLKSDVEVTEEEIQEQYDFDNSRFIDPELRTVQIIPFLTKEGVDEAVANLKSGYTFEGLMESLSLTEDGVTMDRVVKSDILDEIVADAVFEMEKDIISEPINGQLGWAIVRINEIIEGKQQTYEEASEVIKDEMLTSRARRLLDDLYDRTDDELSGGATIEEAAERLGIAPIRIDALDRGGLRPDGQRPESLPENVSAILEETFNADTGYEGELLDTRDDGFFTLRVDSITPSTAKPIADVREEVRDGIVRAHRQEKLESIADSIVERGNAGIPFDELSAELNRSVLNPQTPIRRDSFDETISPAVVAAIFAAKLNEFVQAPVTFGESRLVAVTREIIEPNLAQEQESLDLLATQLADQIANDLADLYIAGLLNELGVTRYESAIDFTLGTSAN